MLTRVPPEHQHPPTVIPSTHFITPTWVTGTSHHAQHYCASSHLIINTRHIFHTNDVGLACACPSFFPLQLSPLFNHAKQHVKKVQFTKIKQALSL